MGICLDCCVSLCAPVSILINSLDIYVQLVHEVVGVILVPGVQGGVIEFLSQGNILVALGAASLSLWLGDSYLS